MKQNNVIMPLKLMYVFILNYSGREKTSRGFLRITRRKEKKKKKNDKNQPLKWEQKSSYSLNLLAWKRNKRKKKKEGRKIEKKKIYKIK